MGLSFLHPALLWGLVAAGLPLLVHLFFRRRPKPIPFPAVDFILRARRETERRLRLKRVLLFVARTALLAAVALAIARPRAERPEEAALATARGPRATAVVLDASASMGYRLGDRTLFERARADALEALASLGPDEPALALACGMAPPAAEAPSFDRAQARRVLESAEATAGHADLTACVAAAIQALGASEAQASLGKRLVVATDLAASAWRLEVPPPTLPSPAGPVRPEVAVLDAARGAPLPNAALTSLEAEPDPAVGPRGYRFSASIADWSGSGRAELPVQLRVGTGAEARTAVRAFVEVPAGGSARKALAHAFAAGGPAAVTVSLPEDALPYDDARALALFVPREVRALVVDGAPSPIKYRDEAYFVETALASPGSPVRPRLVDADAFATEDLPRYDVVLLLNVRSVGAKLGELQKFVAEGGGLLVSLGDQIDPETYAKELPGLLPVPLHVVKTAAERGAADAQGRAARLGEVAFDHPALSVFAGEAKEGLLGSRFFRYALARPGAEARVLATFDDGAPALVEGRRGRGRVLLFTSTLDRDWTDWPIRTSFLPAMQRLAAWLAGGLEERRDPPTVVGSPRAVRLPEGTAAAALIAPDGRERRLPAPAGGRGGEIAFTPDRPGLWQVKVRTQGEERVDPALAFAVWPDARESDTRRLDPEELTAYFGGAGVARVEAEASASGGRSEVPLWSILLAVGVLAFLIEGLLLG
ncbi:MAG TPA: BatA domain-containing protein [Anaeromyxobacteraceae bacterium]|nr:BatA domain-containing protein [Anaeromyxobacteraceae bacterium]